MRELIKSLTAAEQHHRYYIFNTFTGKVLGKGQAPLLYVLSVRVCPVSRRQGWCFHHSCILAFVCRQDFPAKPAAKGLCRACFLILGPNQVVGFAFSGSPASLFSLSLLCLPQPGIAVFMTLPMRPSGWKMKSASLMSCFGRGILQLIVILPLIWVIPICIIYTAGFVYTPRSAQGTCVFRRENHPRETPQHQGQTCFLVYDLKAENVCPVFFSPLCFVQAITHPSVLAGFRGLHLQGHSGARNSDLSKGRNAKAQIHSRCLAAPAKLAQHLALLFCSQMLLNTPWIWQSPYC